jgi:hypothetical protein
MTEQKIVLGTPTPPPSTPTDAKARGYTLGSAGSSDDPLLDRRKEQAPAVRPAVLVACLAVMLVGAVALVAKIASPPQMAIDVDKVVSDYDAYVKRRSGSAPVTGSVVEVRRQLREAAYLENAGRNTEARRLWASLLVACGNASPSQSTAGNPLCDSAAERLKALK